MKSILFIALLCTLSFTVSYAKETSLKTCSCFQSFKDTAGEIGYVTDYAVRVGCPEALSENLDCSAQITSTSFSAICKNLETLEENTASIQIDPWSKPTIDLSYCRIH